MTKEEAQYNAVKLFREHKRLILQWCTSLGKSKAAIDIIKDLDGRILHRNLEILLVVAELAHKENWKKEFDKWCLPGWSVASNIQIVTYASLKKYRGYKFDLIILDEGHHSGSEIRLDILSDIMSDNILVLSATMSDDVASSISNIYGEFAVNRVTLKEAIACGLLPKPDIYLVPLVLNNTLKKHVVIESWGKSAKKVKIKCDMKSRWDIMRNKAKYPNVELHISCTSKEKYDWITNKFEYWKKRYFRTRNEAVKNKWLQYGSMRKRFLGEEKSDYAKFIIKKYIKQKRYVCFCSSIDQANLLGKDNAIHSERKDSLNVIERLNEGSIDNLYTVGMIQEGQNLKNIDTGIIIQLDGVDRSFIQKFGRVLRSKNPVLYILYFEKTKDEEYLNNVLESIDKEYINEIRI